jgi:hypothetical protein
VKPISPDFIAQNREKKILANSSGYAFAGWQALERSASGWARQPAACCQKNWLHPSLQEASMPRPRQNPSRPISLPGSQQNTQKMLRKTALILQGRPDFLNISRYLRADARTGMYPRSRPAP